ncbi:hypothetical protein GCM10023220_47620 [Streptomyces ziwulingensis]|uniref:Anti-sigma factor antagonist n=1 Tax=Streptomyces ziwulingensis TaxID=1045501 RepID=A0ABP9CHX6_9ACTN
MLVTRTVAAGVGVVIACGEIDHDTVARLHDALLPDGTAEFERVVLDLSQVTFMDSSGINTLIGAHRSREAARGWLRLVNPTEPVLRVIELVGLDLLLTCHPSVDQAVTS